MKPNVSVIVPVLADDEALTSLLGRIPPDSAVELVVVDGGLSAGAAAAAARRADVRLVRAAPGRGRQMNAGAADALGNWLLFLHADSRLPPRWRAALEEAVGLGSDPGTPRHRGQTPYTDRLKVEAPVGGWFRFALDDPAWQARWIEKGVALRVRLFRLPYGDQGLFVRRDVFQAMGGYREMPLMEDVDFVRRLRSRGRLVELPAALHTSARRWRQDGWMRRSLRNLGIVSLYFAGVPPARLARWYSR